MCITNGKQYQLPRNPMAAKILKCMSRISKDIRENYIPKELEKQRGKK